MAMDTGDGPGHVGLLAVRALGRPSTRLAIFRQVLCCQSATDAVVICTVKAGGIALGLPTRLARCILPEGRDHR